MAEQRNPRVVFLIRSLHRGGTERQLVALATALSHSMPVAVVTFYPGGAFFEELLTHPLPVHSLDKRGRWDLFRFLWRLWRLLRRFRPAVLQTYLPEPNIFGLVAGRLAGAHVVWGLRSSEFPDSGPLRWSFRLAGVLSRWASMIIVNSAAGRAHHIRHGYSSERMVTVPNGIDTKAFHPMEGLAQWRLAHQISTNTTVIGLVARLDPLKGHPVFLRAAAEVVKRVGGVRFVCVGGGDSEYAARLRALSSELGLDEYVIWAGSQDDVLPIYHSLDIACSASHGEGFSNAIGEAMACGVPCVVTNVGDAKHIVGDTGVVVDAGSVDALCNGLVTVVNMSGADRRGLGARARARIVAEFSTDAMVERTLRVYASLGVGGDVGRSRPHVAADLGDAEGYGRITQNAEANSTRGESG